MTFTSEDLAYLDATYARRDQVPSLDELFVAAAVGPYQSAFSPDSAVYFFTAPFRLKITSGWFYLYSSVDASDTDYVSLSLATRRVADSSYNVIVTGDAKLTGPNAWGSDLPYGRAYSWNAFPFDEAAATMEPGDTLAFGINTTGTPALPRGQAGITVGYVPL